MDPKQKFYSTKFAKKLGPCNRLKKVISIFQHYHFKCVLDIGCGDGSFGILLSNFSDEVYGVDIAEKAVEIAKKKGIKACKIDVDKQSLPFESNYFEAVYCGEVLEHLYDTDHLLNEIYRVLIPDGICVITTPNLGWWLNRLILLLGFQPYLTEVSLKYNVGKFKANIHEVSGHIRSFTNKALRELLKLNNFEVVKMLSSDVANVLPLPLKPFEKVFSLIPSLAHSNIFVLQVRKKGY